MRAGWILALVAMLATGCAKSTRQAAWSHSPKQEVRNAQRVADGDLALQRLRDRVLADPKDVVARIELAGYYDRMGMQELALEHYRLSGVHRPEDELSRLRLAQGLRETNPAEARRELTQFAENYPVRMADTYSLLAILEDDAGNLEGGEALHRKALELAPQADRLHNNLGYNLSQQGRHAEAVKAFRKALALNGRSEVARNNLAAALAEQSSGVQQAFNLWRRAEGKAAAHNNMGALHLRQGDYLAARKEFEEAVRLNPGLAPAWRNLAKLSELDGGTAQVALARTAPATPQSGGHGWRLLRKIFATESTDAVLQPPVTEVSEELDSSSGRMKKQKSAE